MARKKRSLHTLIGFLLGVATALILKTFLADDLSEGEADGCSVQPPKPASDELHTFNPSLNRTIQNSARNLLFVGVMTADSFLASRAKAVYETWGSDLPGQIMFFSSEDSAKNTASKNIPLVALPGVDDSYPPQKKSFLMLLYMHRHFGDKFEWFLRADDDLYVRTDKLESLLRSVDSKKPWFIGQSGRGTKAEFGRLFLQDDENFCMGGTGMIMSRSTLDKVAPHLTRCLTELRTTHEDVELGRCVRRFASVSCTWAYEMRSIMFHSHDQNTFASNLKRAEIHRAITMHPVKQAHLMYRLHDYVKGLKIQSLQQESVYLHRDIASAMAQTGIELEELPSAQLAPNVPLFPGSTYLTDFVQDPKILGVEPSINSHHPTSLSNTVEWDCTIGKSMYSHRKINPKQQIDSSTREGFEDIIKEVIEMLNRDSKQRGRLIDFKDLLYSYYRLDPIIGMHSVIDVLLTYRRYRGGKLTAAVRKHAYIQQSFTGMYFREVTNAGADFQPLNSTEQSPNSLMAGFRQVVSNSMSRLGEQIRKLPLLLSSSNSHLAQPEKITFVMPLAGRLEVLARFMQIYEDVCLRSGEPSRLVIALYRSQAEPDAFRGTADLLDGYRSRYPAAELSIAKGSGEFSRARALQLGAEACRPTDLIFFIDVDLLFSRNVLLRIRQNTVRGRQLYFPIVFSQYDPLTVLKEDFTGETVPGKSLDQFAITETNGYWRRFGFGMTGVYRDDFLQLGGFDTNITGWGMEDSVFFESIVKSNFTIFRAPDPELIHIYHPVKCARSLKPQQQSMCLDTRANNYGSRDNLQRYILKHDILNISMTPR